MHLFCFHKQRVRRVFDFRELLLQDIFGRNSATLWSIIRRERKGIIHFLIELDFIFDDVIEKVALFRFSFFFFLSQSTFSSGSLSRSLIVHLKSLFGFRVTISKTKKMKQKNPRYSYMGPLHICNKFCVPFFRKQLYRLLYPSPWQCYYKFNASFKICQNYSELTRNAPIFT